MIHISLDTLTLCRSKNSQNSVSLLPMLFALNYMMVNDAIAQSVNTLDFNFERAVGGSILTAGKKVESEKSECNNSGYKLTGLTWWP